jgi:hypothetical protein
VKSLKKWRDGSNITKALIAKEQINQIEEIFPNIAAGLAI